MSAGRGDRLDRVPPRTHQHCRTLRSASAPGKAAHALIAPGCRHQLSHSSLTILCRHHRLSSTQSLRNRRILKGAYQIRWSKDCAPGRACAPVCKFRRSAWSFSIDTSVACAIDGQKEGLYTGHKGRFVDRQRRVIGLLQKCGNGWLYCERPPSRIRYSSC